MQYVTLKIQLVDTDISRTIVVPDGWTMEKLSAAIQAAFGWQDCHLWVFNRDDGEEIGLPEMLDDDFRAVVRHEAKSARRAKIRDCFPAKGAKLEYEYDFGDSWAHRITRMADPKIAEVACVKTTGVMGIEDIGGVGGLMDFVAALRKYEANPTKPKGWFKEVFDWVGCKDELTRKRILTPPEKEFITEKIRQAVG